MFPIHSPLLIFPWQGNPWAQDWLACVAHQKALRQWFHWSISWTWITFSSLLLYLLLFFIPVKSLCGLEASCVPTEEVLSVSGESCDSSDEMDTKESINGRSASRKKKSKRHKGVATALLGLSGLLLHVLHGGCSCWGFTGWSWALGGFWNLCVRKEMPRV